MFVYKVYFDTPEVIYSKALTAQAIVPFREKTYDTVDLKIYHDTDCQVYYFTYKGLNVFSILAK